MKNVLLIALLLGGVVAFASDTNPDQAMQNFRKCSALKEERAYVDCATKYLDTGLSELRQRKTLIWNRELTVLQGPVECPPPALLFAEGETLCYRQEDERLVRVQFVKADTGFRVGRVAY